MRWTDSEDIAEELEARHPGTDIINLRFTDFHNWIVELPEFKDDPESSNERILEAIQAAWLELREENEAA
jgi:FeS assembly protein IscX